VREANFFMSALPPSLLPRPAVRTLLGGALAALALPLTVVGPVLTAAPAAAAETAPTTLRISADATQADGRGRVGVRVLGAGGAPVTGAAVALDALSGSGAWVYIGQVRTDGAGLGVANLPFSRNTQVRAVYTGSATQAWGQSAQATARYVPRARLAAPAGAKAVALAAAQRGKPYRWGSTGPSSFDCSGLVTYIYKTQLGKSVPRTSAAQAAALPKVAQAAKQPGDLIFSGYSGRVSHVGIYAGGGKMWAAPTSGGVVQLQPIYDKNHTVGRVV